MCKFRAFCLFPLVFIVISCVPLSLNHKLNNFVAPNEGVVLVVDSRRAALDIRTEESQYMAWTLLSFYGAVGVTIGSVVDNARNEKLEKAKNEVLFPILVGLQNFDIESVYQKEIDLTLEKANWLGIERKISKDEFLEKPAKIGTHFLFFESKLELSQNMDALELTAVISLNKIKRYKTVGKKKTPKFQRIYENRYKYVSPVTAPIIKNDSDIEAIKISITDLHRSRVESIDLVENKSKRWKKREKLNVRRNYDKKMIQASRPYTEKEKQQIMSQYWANEQSRLVRIYFKEAVSEIKEMILYDISNRRILSDEKRYGLLEEIDKNWVIFEKADRRTFEENAFTSRGNLCSLPKTVNYNRCIRAL